MNKTNAGICADKFGKDSAWWVGQLITIWNDPTVLFKGERVGGFKIAIGHLTQPAATSTAIPLPGPGRSGTEPDIRQWGGRSPCRRRHGDSQAGHTVPLPAGMPFAPSTTGVPLPNDTPTPPYPAKPADAGPGSDLDDELPSEDEDRLTRRCAPATAPKHLVQPVGITGWTRPARAGTPAVRASLVVDQDDLQRQALLLVLQRHPP